MLSQTPTEKLCAELASRSAFIVKQREAGIDTTRLESTQASKLCAKIGSTRLDCDAGILVTEAVNEGCWSESHAQSLHVAAANAVADASDDDTVSGSRVQQTCEFPERICVTSTDLSELNDHQGDEEFACLRVGNRAWLGGITCPKESVKARLGAIAMVLGGLPLDVSAKEKKRIAERVRGVVKRRDAKNTHPFKHLPTLPDRAIDLGEERVQYAYGGDEMATISDTITDKIDAVLASGAIRKNHRDVRAADAHLTRYGTTAITMGSGGHGGHRPPIQLGTLSGDDASIGAVMQSGFEKMQQMTQRMCMMQMQCMQSMMQSFGGGSGVVGNGVGAVGFDADGLGSPNDSDRSAGSPLMSWRRGGRVNAMFDDQLRGRRGGQQTHADARDATPITDAGGALGDQPVMANSAELAVGHSGNTGVDDGLAALDAMEKAQIAAAQDRLSAKRAAKSGTKRAAEPSATPDWDVGADLYDDDRESSANDCNESARPKRSRAETANVTAAVTPLRATVKAVTKAIPVKPPAKVHKAPPKAPPTVPKAGKAKNAVKPPAKGKVSAITPKASKVSAKKTKAGAPGSPLPPPPPPLSVAAKRRLSLHGISFADLVQSADAIAAKSKGAYTSKAYDTTKRRGIMKFGKDDVRVLEVSRAAYESASEQYRTVVG
jgi:hypothetical protein